MIIEGSFTVPADRQTVWTNLNDPVVLKSCIAGCDTLEKANDTTFVAIARVKIGPLRTSFTGTIELRDVDAPNGCRLLGTGQGGLAGFARGAADVRLTEASGGTTVSYAVEAQVGGKLAHFGGRMIGGIARRVADRFFIAFTAAIASQEAAAE